MTLESVYDLFVSNSLPITVGLLLLPFGIWLLCYLIPGIREEPFLLSFNLAIAVLAMALWTAYLAYALNVRGMNQLAKEANFLLLLAPPLHAGLSLWVSRWRMPLNQIPAYRTLQGLAMMIAVYFFVAWLAQRIYIVFFSRIAFSQFLLILAIVVAVAYFGYRRTFGSKRP